MTSFPVISLGSAAQIETKILSGEAASDDILSLYKFYCDRKDENNKQRVLAILKNKTLDTRRKPLFIHYGTPEIKISDIKYECFIDKSVLEGTTKFDVFTLSNLLSLPSVTEVICTQKGCGELFFTREHDRNAVQGSEEKFSTDRCREKKSGYPCRGCPYSGNIVSEKAALAYGDRPPHDPGKVQYQMPFL